MAVTPPCGAPALAAVPSLDALANDPARAADLPPNTARALLAQCVLALGALIVPALAVDAPNAATAAAEDEAALGLDAAAGVLAMKPSTLYRKWRALRLGYKDADGRVKFRRSTLRNYIARRGG